MPEAIQIDSNYMGDSSRHRPLAELEGVFNKLPTAPKDRGRLTLIVRKAEGGVRETPDQVTLEPDAGVPGDAWGRNPQRKPDAQITVMQRDVAELVTNGQSLGLPGDN